jgi:hypothetical protein
VTTVVLTFYQRFHLEATIGSFQAPKLSDTLVFLRLLEKLRLTETERKAAQFRLEGNAASWRLPNPEYATREIELEDTEAAALRQAIENFEGIRVIDAQWLAPLVETLRPDSKAEAA